MKRLSRLIGKLRAFARTLGPNKGNVRHYPPGQHPLVEQGVRDRLFPPGERPTPAE